LIKIFILLILAILPGCREHKDQYIGKEKYYIDKEYLKMDGITLGSTEEQMISALGKPDRTSISYNDYKEIVGENIYYKQLYIFLLKENYIAEIECKNSKYVFAKKVKIGMNLNEFRKVMPKGEEKISKNKLNIYYSVKNMDNHYYRFVFSNNILIEVNFIYELI